MKKILYLFALFFLFGIMMSYHKQNTSPKSEFEFFQSFKNSCDNYEYTRLTVIVNVKNYDQDEMFCKIRDRYYELNGIPDVLEISIYNSKKDWEKYKCQATQKFER